MCVNGEPECGREYVYGGCECVEPAHLGVAAALEVLRQVEQAVEVALARAKDGQRRVRLTEVPRGRMQPRAPEQMDVCEVK